MLSADGAPASRSWTPAWPCSRCAALIAVACAAVDGPYVGSEVLCFIICRALETFDASCPVLGALSLQQPPTLSNVGVSSGAAAACGVRHRPRLGAAAASDNDGIAVLDACWAVQAMSPPPIQRWRLLSAAQQCCRLPGACYCGRRHSRWQCHSVGDCPRAVNGTHAPSEWIPLAQSLSA